MFRLYCGLQENGKWYNQAEVVPLKGGTLSLLDTPDKDGATRIKSLVQGSVESLFTESGEELKLTPSHYNDLTVEDAWQIGYEAIKLKTGEKYPIVPENFFCGRCSKSKQEVYTKVEESWAKLIEDGLMDENFLEEPGVEYNVKLENPLIFEPSKIFPGGTFDTLIMKHMSLGDLIKVYKKESSTKTEAQFIRAIWDISLVGIDGMDTRDFNRFTKIPGQSFFEKYITDDDNFGSMAYFADENHVGIDSSRRTVFCENCGNEMTPGIDFTNFFQPLLPKKLSRKQ